MHCEPRFAREKEAHRLAIQSVFCFRRVISFYVNAMWRVCLHECAETLPLGGLKVILMCRIVSIDLSCHDDVGVSHVDSE